jgi:hypothetical protein
MKITSSVWTDIFSEELALFKSNVSELAATHTAALEVQFLKKFPEAVNSEFFLKGAASYVASLEWDKCEKQIQEMISQFYRADIKSFGPLVNNLKDDRFYFTQAKEEDELVGFALFSTTPQLSKGRIKAINLIAKDHQTQSAIFNHFIEQAPDTKKVFIYQRPTTNVEGLKALGFKRNDSPEMDPKHPINLQNFVCWEWSR